MEHRRNLNGIWPVMVTPYTDRLQIDVGAYREIVEWFLSFDVGGIYANCQSSEMYELTEEERLLLIRETVKTVNGRVPVAVTGNFGESIEAHIEFCKKAADLGPDVVMLTVPTLFENDESLEGYFLSIAERTDMPLGLYECPFPRTYHLGLDLIETLANSGRFIAYKETSCRLEKIIQVIDIVGDTPLALLQANVPYLLESMRAGAAGSMNIVANWLPDLTIEVAKRSQAIDPLADELQNLLCAMEMAQRSVHPTGVKYLMSKRGLPIKPLTRYPRALSQEEKKGLDLAARVWFEKDGTLKALQQVVDLPGNPKI